MPVALNCSVWPCAIESVSGETEMLTSVAVVTVKMAVPLTRPDVAVIVLTPVPTPVARP